MTGFCHENQTKSVLLSSPSYELKNVGIRLELGAVAYPLIVSTRFRIQTRPYHEATTLHGVTTLQASLPKAGSAIF